MAVTLERPARARGAEPTRPAVRRRSLALDALRGFCIVVMVVCNHRGLGGSAFPGTSHSPWHGWSFADLFFPAFLFVVGGAMAFSLGEHADGGGGDARFHLRLVRRAAILFLLGLFLHGFPFGDLAEIRVMGVLQRIALAFLGASLIAIHLRPRLQWLVGGGLLAASWALVALVPVPGAGGPSLTPAHNLPGAVDAALLGVAHMYKNTTYDPEGLFGTANAVVTVLAGYWVLRWLRRQPVATATSLRLAAGGVAAVLVAHGWDLVLPINKRLWTSSFVLLCAGAAAVMLAVAFEVLEVRGRTRWGHWLQLLGLNAIVLYVGTELTGEYFERWGVKDAVVDALVWALPATITSLSYALVILGMWSGIAWVMARRRWFVKV